MGISSVSQKQSRRELIVVLKPSVGIIDHTAEVVASTAGGSDLAHILNERQAVMRPIFNRPTSFSRAPDVLAHSAPGLESDRYHEVIAPDDQLDELKTVMDQHPSVETSYVKPASSTPTLQIKNQPTPKPNAVQVPTPAYLSHQQYLAPAPIGIDAHFAWTFPGGRGSGVAIVDCEWSWNTHHEDLATHVSGVIAGTPSTGDDNHGTSVIGCIIGNDNDFGITGIAPEATLGLAAFPGLDSDKGTAAIIDQAAAHLAAGDILLLEIHRPGPQAPDPERGQLGYIAVEWWPDDFLAIVRATQRGVLVVEAAGNGSQNLDDPVYNQRPRDFPTNWHNPFAIGSASSGAVLVGAGNPPAGTHGRTHDTLGFNETYVDRARCVFSNYGSRIDCQGWGWEVTTLGGGDLGADADHNRLYTDVFAGTSSASPIIAGVLACVQGALRAKGLSLLTPDVARNVLLAEGSPQQPAPHRGIEQRIGLRPDLRKIMTRILPTGTS